MQGGGGNEADAKADASAQWALGGSTSGDGFNVAHEVSQVSNPGGGFPQWLASLYTARERLKISVQGQVDCDVDCYVATVKPSVLADDPSRAEPDAFGEDVAENVLSLYHTEAVPTGGGIFLTPWVGDLGKPDWPVGSPASVGEAWSRGWIQAAGGPPTYPFNFYFAVVCRLDRGLVYGPP